MPPLSPPFTISPRSLAKPFDAACARLIRLSSHHRCGLGGSTSGPQTPRFDNSSPTGSAGSLPEAPYSFGVLETAQALGDFQSLDRTGRRGLLVRLSERDVDQFERVAKQLVEAL